MNAPWLNQCFCAPTNPLPKTLPPTPLTAIPTGTGSWELKMDDDE